MIVDIAAVAAAAYCLGTYWLRTVAAAKTTAA